MSPKTQKNTKTIIVGEGRGFDRIRRITGYLVGPTAGTTPNAPKNTTA